MIELMNVTKKFDDFTAVDNLSLSIPKGEIVGLLGPNGAGKSTTISMIATLFRPTTGRILYGGEDIIKKPKAIQPNLGYVPQEIALYGSLSGEDNLRYFGGLYGLKGAALKERMAVVSEIIGIGDRIKERVENYSGGMKRRLNIGVALLHNPEFIIMDEPTVGIDPQSRNHILETVKRLNEAGTTVLYTSHYMEEVSAICSHVHIMDKGKLIASGSQSSLLEQSGIQTALHMKFEKDIRDKVAQLKALTHVMAVTVLGDCELSIAVSFEHAVKDILKEAMQLDAGLVAFDVVKPNLEQVFLKMTGRALRD